MSEHLCAIERRLDALLSEAPDSVTPGKIEYVTPSNAKGDFMHQPISWEDIKKFFSGIHELLTQVEFVNNEGEDLKACLDNIKVSLDKDILHLVNTPRSIQYGLHVQNSITYRTSYILNSKTKKWELAKAYAVSPTKTVEDVRIMFQCLFGNIKSNGNLIKGEDVGKALLEKCFP